MKFLKRLFLAVVILVILIVGGITFMGYSMYSQAINEVSISDRISKIKEDENYVSINEISNDFKNALIAIEDHRFREHSGIDIITTTRSMIENIREKDIVARTEVLLHNKQADFYILHKNNVLQEKLLNYL